MTAPLLYDLCTVLSVVHFQLWDEGSAGGTPAVRRGSTHLGGTWHYSRRWKVAHEVGLQIRWWGLVVIGTSTRLVVVTNTRIVVVTSTRIEVVTNMIVTLTNTRIVT